MASDLSPTEKEDQESERLIGKKPAPSRKPAERRGPKYDNRRRRIEVDDPDVDRVDPDLSLNYKSSSLADAALLIMFHQAAQDAPVTKRSPVMPAPEKTKPSEKTKPPGKPKAPTAPKESKPKAPKSKSASPELLEEIHDAFQSMVGLIRDVAPALADEITSRGNSVIKEVQTDAHEAKSLLHSIKQSTSSVRKNGHAFSRSLRGKGSAEIADAVAKQWSRGDGGQSRMEVLLGLKEAIDAIPIPDAFKAPFLRMKPGDVISDRKLLQNVIKSTAGGPSVKDIKQSIVIRFAQLASALQILAKNPDSVSKRELTSGMENLSKTVGEQSRQLLELGSIMDEWHKAMSEFRPAGPSDVAPGKDLDRVLGSIQDFWSRSKKPVVDPSAYMGELEKYVEKKYGEVPDQLESMFEGFKRAAASNDGSSVRIMSVREATYHGVKQQGHPSGPTVTEYKSYDKRYFGKDHFDSILKFAKELMEEDWLKYEWEGGAPDARFRAALDLSIHLADNNLYQSKIDTETYDMLLNRLAGWNWDTFSETVLPIRSKASRSASKMNKTQAFKNPHVEKIARIASEIRQKDPQAALEIVKNLRALVSSEAPAAQDMRAHLAQEEQEEEQEGGHTSQQQVTGQQQQEQQGQQQQQSQQQEQAQQQQGQQEQQGGGPGESMEFKSMSDEDFKKLKDEAKKLFEAKDVEEFMKGLDEILDEAGVKTASARIPLSLLVRIASALPAARPVLLPVIVAATKKKKDKKKPAKTSQQEKSSKKKETSQEEQAKSKGKKPPFGGKKAPPFGGKKAPPFGKKAPKGRKASVEIETSDLNW